MKLWSADETCVISCLGFTVAAINTLDNLFEGEHLNAVKFFFNKKGGNLGASLSI